MKRPGAALSAALLLTAAAPLPAAAGIQPVRAGARWALIVNAGPSARGSAQGLARVLDVHYGYERSRIFLVNDPDATAERMGSAMAAIQERLQTPHPDPPRWPIRPDRCLLIQAGVP